MIPKKPGWIFFLYIIFAAITGCINENNRTVIPLNESTNITENDHSGDIPEHLNRWPGLYIRKGSHIIEAPAEDQKVARSYPKWPHKGLLSSNKRLTILTKKTKYSINEEVRVIHVFEETGPGQEVYIMGPKSVYGEYINDKLATEHPPKGDKPWIPTGYNGATLESPAVDYNYDITSYRFAEPGAYRIYWKLAELKSNTIVIEVN